MFYFENIPDNLKIFNKVLKISDANGRLIRGIKLGADKIGFNVDGDIFKVLSILGEDLLCQFMNTVVIEDNKHDDYIDDCPDYLSSKIEAFLESNKMILPELAEFVGVVDTELKQFIYEKDNNYIMRYDVLNKLAIYFGCTYSELCDVNHILKRTS